MSPIFRPETTADHAAIGEGNWTAFGGEGEARLVDALREGGYARVLLVEEEDGRVVGHIRVLSPVRLLGDAGRAAEVAVLNHLARFWETFRQPSFNLAKRHQLAPCWRGLSRKAVLALHNGEKRKSLVILTYPTLPGS